jgi:Mrp family chromosome partitioning ATPase
VDHPALFISHAHADNEVCDRYAAALRARGVDVRYDRDDLQRGQMLSAEIERELARRPVLVVLLSAAALGSYWVDIEVQAFRSLIAQERQRVLPPVRIGACEVPLLMRGVAWIDGLDRPVEQVADEIARALGGAAPPAPHATTSEPAPLADASPLPAAAEVIRTLPPVPPPSPAATGPGLILAIANQKTRTGKTTTAVNVAAYLANAGHKMLLVDASSGADSTKGLGVDLRTVGPSMYELLVADGVSPEEAILAGVRRNLALLPATADLVAAELDLPSADNREYRLARALDRVKRGYDVILIDCPSLLGMVTLNALTAADGVILPLLVLLSLLGARHASSSGLSMIQRGSKPVRASSCSARHA